MVNQVVTCFILYGFPLFKAIEGETGYSDGGEVLQPDMSFNNLNSAGPQNGVDEQTKSHKLEKLGLADYGTDEYLQMKYVGCSTMAQLISGITNLIRSTTSKAQSVWDTDSLYELSKGDVIEGMNLRADRLKVESSAEIATILQKKFSQTLLSQPSIKKLMELRKSGIDEREIWKQLSHNVNIIEDSSIPRPINETAFSAAPLINQTIQTQPSKVSRKKKQSETQAIMSTLKSDQSIQSYLQVISGAAISYLQFFDDITDKVNNALIGGDGLKDRDIRGGVVGAFFDYFSDSHGDYPYACQCDETQYESFIQGTAEGAECRNQVNKALGGDALACSPEVHKAIWADYNGSTSLAAVSAENNVASADAATP